MRNLANRRKGFSLLMVALLILMAVITGCGGSGTEPASTDDEVNNDSEAPKEDPAEDEVVAVDKESLSANLKVLTPWGGGFREQFEKLFADFNLEYPNIKVELMEQTTADFTALIAAGEIPDVVSSNGTDPKMRADNLIDDLTPLIKVDPIIKPALYYEPAYTRSITPDGKIWALPWHVDPNFAFMYNKDILDQYGFTEIPETHTLAEMGDFLKNFWVVENGEQVMTTFEPNSVYGPNNSLITWSFANGADASTFYNSDTQKVTYNDPKIVQALEWIVQFKRENIDDDRLGKLQASLPKDTGRFQAGKSLLEPHVTPTLRGNYEQNPDLGFAMMPEESLWVGGWSFSLAAAGNKDNKKAAWELLKWMTSTKEGAKSQQTHFGWISGIADNPHLEELAKTDPVTDIAYQVLQKAKKTPPQIPVDNAKEFDAKYAEVMAGTLEPKAFLDHMTKFTQALLDEQVIK